jgi:hypothetical protein
VFLEDAVFEDRQVRGVVCVAGRGPEIDVIDEIEDIPGARGAIDLIAGH